MRFPTVAIILLTTSIATSRASVFYRETFGAGAAGQQSLSTDGWSAYYGNATTSATLALPGNSGAPANAQISNGTGNPTNLPNINAGPSPSQSAGFVPLISIDGQQNFLLYTSEFPLDRTTQSINTFTWFAGSRYAGDTHRIAIEIGATWYTSTTPQSPASPVLTGSVFSTSSTQLTSLFDPAATNWQILNFTLGSPLTLGDTPPVPLPAGDITSFGLFIQLADHPGATDERTYVDTFTVNATAIPEPSAILLTLSGFLMARASRPRLKNMHGRFRR